VIDDHDDAQARGCEDRDQEGLFEEVTGYPSFAYWVASAVNQECQLVNTDLGVIPFET
jgi:hypothetical protein